MKDIIRHLKHPTRPDTTSVPSCLLVIFVDITFNDCKWQAFFDMKVKTSERRPKSNNDDEL